MSSATASPVRSAEPYAAAAAAAAASSDRGPSSGATQTGRLERPLHPEAAPGPGASPTANDGADQRQRREVDRKYRHDKHAGPDGSCCSKKPDWVMSYQPVTENQLKDLATVSFTLAFLQVMSDWRNTQADDNACAVFMKKVVVGIAYLLLPIIALIEAVVRAIITICMTPGFLGLLKDGPHNKTFLELFGAISLSAYINLATAPTIPFLASYHNVTSGPVPSAKAMVDSVGFMKPIING